VLVSIESFSASFMGALRQPRAASTPRMDAPGPRGLLFTQVVRHRHAHGAGARRPSTLSVPPTPGHSIVKRPGTEGLFTLGSVLADQGYEPIYLYGGYGYFDNMNAFFGGNGYTVIDRTALRKDRIDFENIWGVADENLFTLRCASSTLATPRPALLRPRDDDLQPPALHLPGAGASTSRATPGAKAA
jgi:hypothetical protein